MHKVGGGEEGGATGYVQLRRVKRSMHIVGGGEGGCCSDVQ